MTKKGVGSPTLQKIVMCLRCRCVHCLDTGQHDKKGEHIASLYYFYNTCRKSTAIFSVVKLCPSSFAFVDSTTGEEDKVFYQLFYNVEKKNSRKNLIKNLALTLLGKDEKAALASLKISEKNSNSPHDYYVIPFGNGRSEEAL